LKTTKCVVITGSIGCGKSSVCEILSQKGYEIIDADKIARELFETSSEEIKKTFGAEAANDRKVLAKIVFEDEAKRKQLEQIMHPKIKETILVQMNELEKKGKIYFIDIPLFFETKNYDLSPVAVVYAPKDKQLSRIVARGGIDEIEAQNRINAQIDIEQKAKMADFIIDNSGDIDGLEPNTEKFLQEVKQWFYKNTAQAETIF
jgi:dephospho-CoA kinase